MEGNYYEAGIVPEFRLPCVKPDDNRLCATGKPIEARRRSGSTDVMVGP